MSSSVSYHVVNIEAPASEVDLLSGLLHTLGCLGVEEIPGGKTQLKTYFADTLSLNELLKKIKKSLDREYPMTGTTISLNTTPFQAQTFEPIELVKNVWIVPPPDMPTETKIETGKKLIIRPGAAFGTGRHESTQLAAEGIEYCRGAASSAPTILDVGTGSGILAIFATSLGFHPVHAAEIDAEGRINATENFELNHCSIPLVDDISKLIEKNEKYDVIVANILAPTIIHLKPQLESLLKPGGKMILSGIVESESEQIEKAFEKLKLVCRLKKNEWVCYCYEEGEE